MILHLLRVLLALKVGLHECPLPLGECPTAFIRVHVNPCDDDDEAAVATGFRVIPANGKKGLDATIKGYATLRVSNQEPTATVHIELSGNNAGAVISLSIPDVQPRNSGLNATGMMSHSKTATRLWRQARRQADLDAGGRGIGTGNADVLVDFSYLEDKYVIAVEIGARDIEAAKTCFVNSELAEILLEASIMIPSSAWTPETVSIMINGYIDGDT